MPLRHLAAWETVWALRVALVLATFPASALRALVDGPSPVRKVGVCFYERCSMRMPPLIRHGYGIPTVLRNRRETDDANLDRLGVN